MNAASSSQTGTASRPADTAVRAKPARCADEPIHTPEAIQPFGFLLALDAESLVVQRASANAADSLGLPMAEILGAPIECVLGGAGETNGSPSCSAIAAWLRGVDEREALDPPHKIGMEGTPFHLVAHRTDAWIVLEGESMEPGDDLGGVHARTRPSAQTVLDRMQAAGSLDALCEVAAREVRHMTGMDRVEIYRFDADWNGQVVAESLAHEGSDAVMPSYLGLHFPASDIPTQARALYLRDRFRFIADASYSAIPIVSASDSGGDAPEAPPLDLSRSVLRSVSPVHLKYLRNMGAHASLSASIIHEGRLWGLIACHHHEPISLPYPTRAACGFIGQMLGLLIRTELSADELRAGHRRHHVQRAMLDQLMTSSDLSEALTMHAPSLLDLIDAEGAVLYDAGRVHRIGTTPSDGQLDHLVGWLDEQASAEGDDTRSEDATLLRDAGVFFTNTLPRLYPPAQVYSALGSGVMAISLSQMRRYYVLWFRAEEPHAVFWAGDPSKTTAMAAAADGVPRRSAHLHPRHSFERWRELRHGTSRAWQQSETRAAAELKRLITEVIFVKTEQTDRLNATLARANAMLTQRSREMEEFAYVASHDLQEPLRKIQTFAELLEDEHSEGLDDTARDYLHRLSGASGRMSHLIRDLLAYSRVVTRARPFEPVDTERVIESVRLACELELRERGGVFEVEGTLPTVEADLAHLEELFGHLVSNALKFTAPGAAPHIRIRAEAVAETDGFAPPPDFGGDGHGGSEQPFGYRFFVQDSGIGFDEKYLDRVFVPFQRLAARGAHAGTGIGLALCRRIAQHHGGTITATSTPGKGSTFVVTLPCVQARGEA